MGSSPAFQLYAADFYMDTASWTIEEVGIYTRLLFYQWVNGSIPNDEKRLSRIAGCTTKSFQKWWCQIKLKFSVWDDENLINLRLEETRKKQLNHSEKQANRANARWKRNDAAAYPTAEAAAMPDGCSSSSSSKKEKKKYIKKENIQFLENKFKSIPDDLMSKWREVAPGINIQDEIKKAELWLLAHPEKRRSKWTAFLSNWMVRAQENFIKYGGVNVRTTGTIINDKRQTLSDKQRADDDYLAKRVAEWEAAQKPSGGNTRGNASPDDVPDFPVRGE